MLQITDVVSGYGELDVLRGVTATFEDGKVVSVTNDFHPLLVLAQIGAVRGLDE